MLPWVSLVWLLVVARGHPCLLVGDFNVEPTKIFRPGSGLTLRRLGLLLQVCNLSLLASGTWSAACGHRRDFMVGCPLAVAAVLSCKVQPGRWVAPTQPVQHTSL